LYPNITFGTFRDSRTPRQFAPDCQAEVKIKKISGSGSGLPPITSLGRRRRRNTVAVAGSNSGGGGGSGGAFYVLRFFYRNVLNDAACPLTDRQATENTH
jgi:hypothetical protein